MHLRALLSGPLVANALATAAVLTACEATHPPPPADLERPAQSVDAPAEEVDAAAEEPAQASSGSIDFTPRSQTSLSGARFESLPLERSKYNTVPVSGGTLLALRDGRTVVASDPDRDVVYVVDLEVGEKVHEIPLAPGDEPGRLAEGEDGVVHVVARNGGALITILALSGTVLGRTDVCASPRGVDAEPDGHVVVACLSGQVLEFASHDAEPTVFTVGNDLRDIVIVEDQLYVTKFRAVEVLELDANRELTNVYRSSDIQDQYRSTVAYRMRQVEGGTLLIQHQRSSTKRLPEVEKGVYGNTVLSGPATKLVATCGGLGFPSVSVLAPGGSDLAYNGMLGLELPVDFAVDEIRQRYTLVGFSSGGSRIFDASLSALRDAGPCNPVDATITELPGFEVTSVEYTQEGQRLLLSRQPAVLFIEETKISLSDDERIDAAHAVFHLDTGSGIACATCHPEAGDDGHTWQFQKAGALRTQHLRGGIANTAPYHWNGEFRDFSDLLQDVFIGRMNGPPLKVAQAEALSSWLNELPPFRGTALDPERLETGRAAFEKAACDACHSGPYLTNNQSYDVGSGDRLQVPSLIGLAARAPYMHDGCAETIASRFAECDDPKHGNVALLSAEEVDAVIAYLGSL